MEVDLVVLVGSETVWQLLQEVQEEIRNNGINRCEQVSLYHQLGSLYGLLGKTEKQKLAWEKAQALAPTNQMVIASLKSLTI